VIEAIIAAFTCSFLLVLADIVLIAIHATVPTWLAAFICWSAPLNTRRDSPQIHVPHTTALLAGFLLFGGGALFFLVSLSSLFIGTVLEPLRIEADAEGVTWYGVWGLRRHISWQDARLLEVKSYTISQGSGRPARQTFRYTLRGHGGSIRWYQLAGRNGRPLPDFARLLSAVIAHTGLQVRTLDPKLLAPNESLQLDLLDRIDERFALTLSLGALPLALTALVLIEPRAMLVGMTVLGVFLGVIFVAFAVSKLEGRVRRARGIKGGEGAGPVEPPTLMPDGVYEMTVGSVIIFRFNQISCACLGAVAALFGAFLLILSLVPVLQGRGSSSAPPGVVVGCACAFILGTATFVISVSAKDTIVLADADGIRKRWLLGNTFIPWAQVEGIRRRFIWGMDAYKVEARGGGPAISWPIAPFHPSRKPQEPGAVQLTPEQMATLVAQHIGQEIQISD